MVRVSSNGYILCPACGRPTKTRVTPGDTKLHRFPLWCSRCKKEFVIQYPDARADSQS